MLNSRLGIRDIVSNPKSIFYLLNKEEKDELQHHVSISRYKRNEYLFKEGEKPSCFMILIEGKVKLYKVGVGGREQIIRMEKPFGVIGHRALLSYENYIATAITLEECLIGTVSPVFIFEYALKNSNFSNALITKLAKELGFSNNRMVTLSQKHIRGRLAESLLLLKDKYGFELDGTTLKVYLSRENISNLSNMTPSNAIRTLSTFATENVIAIDGRKIKILDITRLERISKLG